MRIWCFIIKMLTEVIMILKIFSFFVVSVIGKCMLAPPEGKA